VAQHRSGRVGIAGPPVIQHPRCPLASWQRTTRRGDLGMLVLVFLSPTTHHLPIHLLAIVSVWPTLYPRERMGWWGGGCGRWSEGGGCGTPWVVVRSEGGGPGVVSVIGSEGERRGVVMVIVLRGHRWRWCKGITQTLIPDTLAVKPKASQSTDGNLLWSVVYISDTACPHVGAADDTRPALADPHPLRQPWPVTGGYAAGVP
jgi:hypothetical protein